MNRRKFKSVKDAHFNPNDPYDLPEETEEIIIFPSEFKNSSIIPNIILRSNLFGLTQRRKVSYVKEKVIISQAGYKITFTGEEFGQGDLDVWAILKKECVSNNNEITTLQTKEVLKKLGKTYGQSDKRWLRGKILRLAAALVTCHYNGSEIMTHFLKDVFWIDDYNTVSIKLDERILPLFGKNDCSYINLPTRIKLKKELTKWLYSFLVTHKKVFCLKVETYHQLCGSKNTDLRDFKRKLKNSLEELKKLSIIKEFTINKNVVQIIKNPPPREQTEEEGLK